jgi:hypothetical protein
LDGHQADRQRFGHESSRPSAWRRRRQGANWFAPGTQNSLGQTGFGSEDQKEKEKEQPFYLKQEKIITNFLENNYVTIA